MSKDLSALVPTVDDDEEELLKVTEDDLKYANDDEIDLDDIPIFDEPGDEQVATEPIVEPVVPPLVPVVASTSKPVEISGFDPCVRRYTKTVFWKLPLKRPPTVPLVPPTEKPAEQPTEKTSPVRITAAASPVT